MSTDETPSSEFHIRFEREMSAREQTRKRIASEQVSAFIEEIKQRYGIEDKEIPELLNGLRWAVGYKKKLDKVGMAAVISILGLALTGLATAMWEGIKHFVQRAH